MVQKNEEGIMHDKVFVKKRTGTFEKKCKHFDGRPLEEDKECNAGVKMKDVVKREGYKYKLHDSQRLPYQISFSMPCFTDSDPLKVCSCEKQDFPTKEEIKEHKSRGEKRHRDHVKARKKIIEHCKGQPGNGEIPCVVCDGKLKYSLASVNGHVWAMCTTEGCLYWIE